VATDAGRVRPLIGYMSQATGTIVTVVEADPWQRAYAELAAWWPGATLRGLRRRPRP